ncbi:proprotein convertase P-domain-containing protein [Actinokineospora diospyrosa]|uniref:Streptogrisin C n=1 Tax=Actinokineospora diospyrosa TaxID=103728 RepID=A0ABT1IIQ9_9PSEU|nr:proprotein convertase P-domain-containing protein [Actinokineospora diospyrosa]MCP2272547.1 streptogrisin C [Actinokineospora diospyrosa]
MRLRTALWLACALTLSVSAGYASGAGSEPEDPVVDALSRDLGISRSEAQDRLADQAQAQLVAAALPRAGTAGMWLDGGLKVAVTDEATAAAVRDLGAQPVKVSRDQATLDRLVKTVADRAFPGVTSWGVDPQHNDVAVRIDRTRTSRAFPAIEGVRVVETTSSPVQQAGTVQPGNPWWPGSESNCSVGFPATDSSGGKHFLTAGHCTNDANQAAYGQSGSQNRIGTSNVGGSRTVNAREGDMGVVAVTEAGWSLSASVNTWGGSAVTVTGSVEPLVGQAVCHSGNTSKWQCGEVTAINQSINYGSVVVEGLATTTACSLGGDSGGAWLAGDKAVGLHSGGASSCSPGGAKDQSIFQPVNEALRKWNLTLVTGGGGGDTQAPTAPANPRSTDSTSTSVTLAWDAATDNVGVTGYTVYNGTAVAATVAATTATVTGLSPDTAYTFTIKANDAAGNSSPASAAVQARTKPGNPGGSRTFRSDTDFPIRDYQTVVSPLTATASGKAATTVSVTVAATHTCLQDLNITLVGPSGTWYTLQRYGGYQCTAFPNPKTFTVPNVNENATGKWTLRIGDNGPGDTGVLDAWTVTL